MKKRLS